MALSFPINAARAESAPPQSQLDKVEKSLNDARERQKRIDEQVARARRELADIRARLVRAAGTAQAQEDAVAEIEGRLDELQASERQKTADLERRRSELAATLSALARLTRTPPEAMIASPESAVDTLRSSALLGSIVPELQQRAAALRNELDQLAEIKRQLSDQQQKLGQAIAKLDAERKALDRLLSEKARTEQQFEAEQQAEAARLAKLGEQATDLKALVQRLAEDERRRKAKAEAEAEARAKAETEAARQRLAALPPPTEPAPLPSANPGAGLITVPAHGHVVELFGRSNNNGVINKGVTIETRPGAQVVAPADGEIVFAGPFRGYGRLLIIAHGDGYHSLLAGFAHIDGTVGQWLLAGEPVGQMADEDGQKPLLYVEVRRKGEPIDPVLWLSASERKVSG